MRIGLRIRPFGRWDALDAGEWPLVHGLSLSDGGAEVLCKLVVIMKPEIEVSMSMYC